MRLSEVMLLADMLGAMRINKVKDSDAKAALNRSFVAVQRHRRAFYRDRDEIVEKYRSDYADELAEIAKGKPESEAIQKAKADLSVAINGLLDAEVEVALCPASVEPLYDPDIWGPDDTLAQIANTVDVLVQHGAAKEE